MTTISLTRAEAAILQAAATDEGRPSLAPAVRSWRNANTSSHAPCAMG